MLCTSFCSSVLRVLAAPLMIAVWLPPLQAPCSLRQEGREQVAERDFSSRTSLCIRREIFPRRPLENSSLCVMDLNMCHMPGPKYREYGNDDWLRRILIHPSDPGQGKQGWPWGRQGCPYLLLYLSFLSVARKHVCFGHQFLTQCLT